MTVNIACYLSHACGSEETLRANIAAALKAEAVDGEVLLRRVDDEEASALGLGGSPTVLINGKELQPLGTAGFS